MISSLGLMFLVITLAGHFYFTQLLLPSLRAGAMQSDDRVARIINTSSQTHVTGSLNFDSLKDGKDRRKLSRSQLYSQSAFVGLLAPLCQIVTEHRVKSSCLTKWQNIMSRTSLFALPCTLVV